MSKSSPHRPPPRFVAAVTDAAVEAVEVLPGNEGDVDDDDDDDDDVDDDDGCCGISR